MKKKAQAAMEYLVLTGFTMLILMILLVTAYTKIADTEKQIDLDATERAVLRLKEAADFVYIHGHPTKLEISAYLPGDIERNESFISNSTINFAVRSKAGHTDVWRSTRGEVGWDLEGGTQLPVEEGYYVFTVESTDYDSVHGGTINIHE
jgi:uncharacterized protein (UPF0333 family)